MGFRVVTVFDANFCFFCLRFAARFFFCLRLWKIVCLFLFLQPSFYTIKVEDNKEITTVLLDLATSI